jgi:hypothetical protein
MMEQQANIHLNLQKSPNKKGNAPLSRRKASA